MKKLVFILLPLFAFILIACGDGDSNSEVGDSSGKLSTSGKLSHSEVLNLSKGVGEATGYSDWDYKVNKVETHNTIGEYTARGVYIVALTEVVNNSKSPRELSSFFEVLDSEGRVYSFNSEASLEYHHKFKTDAWHLDEIGSSFSATMPLAFDVPRGAKDLVMSPKGINMDNTMTELPTIILLDVVE